MHQTMNFPQLILVAPDLRVIGLDPVLCSEAIRVLKAIPNNNSVLFQYDTTFTLTCLYVSVLSFYHPLLWKNTQKPPMVPLAYLFHEKKYEKTHDEFFRYDVFKRSKN